MSQTRHPPSSEPSEVEPRIAHQDEQKKLWHSDGYPDRDPGEGGDDWRPEDPEAWARAAAASQARAEADRNAVAVAAPPDSRRSSRRPSSSSRSRSSSHHKGRSRSRSRSRRRRRPRRHRGLKLALLFGGLLLLGAGGILADAYYQVYRISSPLEEIRGHLSEARSSLIRGKLPAGDPFTEAAQVADQAAQEVESARFTFDLVGRIPLLGRPIQISRQHVVAANEWAISATIARDMIVDLLGEQSSRADDLQQLEESSQDIPLVTDGNVNLPLVRGLAPKLESLIAHLEAADRAIRAMPEIPWPPRLAGAKERALAESSEALRAARDALSGITLLPSFLGGDEPKTYYVALQNTADQRGTGGAVLAYGILTIEKGRMTLEEAGGINAIDDQDRGIRGVRLPPAVSWYINAAHVNPRLANGANYSPDFPVVASAWAAMVEKAAGKHVDGVIALDPAAISYSLGNNTKIKVRSYPDEITGDNAVFVVSNDQYRLDQDVQRIFAAELINAAWPKLRDPRPFVRKLQQLGVALEEKHIQVWSRDPEQQELIEKLNWDGGLEAGAGDFVMLTHNKRNGNKSDYYLEQTITYDVTVLPSGDVDAEYRVELSAEMPDGEPPAIAGHKIYGLNVAMESLYVPERARFGSVEPTGLVDYPTRPDGFIQHVEGNFRVFTRPVVVTPGSPGTIVLRYTVPNVVKKTDEGDVYELAVQHQPMVNAAQMTVNVTVPQGREIVPAEGWTVEGRTATYSGSLTTDLALRLVF